MARRKLFIYSKKVTVDIKEHILLMERYSVYEFVLELANNIYHCNVRCVVDELEKLFQESDVDTERTSLVFITGTTRSTDYLANLYPIKNGSYISHFTVRSFDSI